MIRWVPVSTKPLISFNGSYSYHLMAVAGFTMSPLPRLSRPLPSTESGKEKFALTSTAADALAGRFSGRCRKLRAEKVLGRSI